MFKKSFFLVLIIIVLVIAYNLIGQIISTLRSGDRLQTATDELYNLEQTNKELKKKLTEVKSKDFIEQQARDKLGLGKGEETVVVIPDEKIKSVLGTEEGQKEEIKLPNYQGWISLFWN